jgi:hypothetical protein
MSMTVTDNLVEGTTGRWRPHPPDMLVDRDREVERLRRSVAVLSREHRSGLITFTGRRGLGLTKMIELVLAQARAAGLATVSARCSPAESDLAFGVVHQLATPMGAAVAGHAGRALRRPTETAISTLCADFLAAAWSRPLVIAVDDAQWADRASRAWLHAMARRLSQAPILLVQATTHPGNPWQVDPRPSVTQVLRLRPLGEHGVREMITSCYTGPVDRAFVAGATAATGGSPAVLEAVLAHFANAALAPVAEHLPILTTRADAVLGDRAADTLSALVPDALALLRALSLCGDQLGVELTCSLITPRVGPAATLAQLAQSGLIGSADAPLPISAQVRASALAGMSAGERNALLRRAVEVARRAAIPDDRLAALLLAAPPVRAGWAADLIGRVASRRREEGDHHAAGALLARALTEPLEPVPRQHTLVALGSVEVVANPHAADRRLREALLDGEPTSPLCVRAADLLQLRGDAPAASRVIASACARAGGSGAAALAVIGWLAENDCAGDAVRPGRSFPDPPTEPDDPDDPVLAAAAAWMLTLRGVRRGRVQELARVALRTGSTSAGGPLPFGLRIHACRALLAADDIGGAVLGVDAVRADARKHGARVAAAAAQLLRAWCELRRGNLAQAEEDLEHASDYLPVRHWHARRAPLVRALAGLLHLARNDIDAAERVVLAEQPEPAGQGTASALLDQVRGEVALAQDDPGTALRRALACGRALSARGWTNPALSSWRSLAAAAHVRLGDESAARVHTTEAVDRAVCWGAPSTLAQVRMWASRVGQGARAGAAGIPLSSVDERIATLAGSGRSAAEIAELLAVPVVAVRGRLGLINTRLTGDALDPATSRGC